MYRKGQGKKPIYSLLTDAIRREDVYFDMSGGEQLRDYLHVDQIAEYLTRLLCKQIDAGIANICSGAPRSMRGIVETWVAENDWQINLRLGRHPYPDYEPFAFWGKRSKASFYSRV